MTGDIRLKATCLALALGAAASAQAATFVIVNNDPPGVGFNDTTPVAPVGNNPETTLGAQRLFAVQFVTDTWGALLESPVTIEVRTQWVDLTCTQNSAVLGSAGPISVNRDFPNAPESNTWYPIALANSLEGADAIPPDPDINMNININIDGDPGCLGGATWYLGLDDNNPGGTVDIVPLVLHELGHGLGFLTLVNSADGTLFSGRNDIYMLNLRDTEVDLDWDEMDNAQRQASAINDPDLVWTGPNVTANASSFVGQASAFSDGFMRMNAPDPLQPGSSVSHWAAGPWTLLMEPSLSGALFDEVDLTIDLFADIGWQTTVATDVIFADGFE
ncbi:MAG: hypothetical protein CMP07_04720 [Xanthomonadales bacterium]|nr:hypothetical protein [Xanthomonadales bacterium]